MDGKKDKTKIKIEDLLRSHPDGLTIKEMMDKTGLARHTLLARLHHLKGEDRIGVRQINMAKLHRWKHENEPLKEEKEEDVKLNPIKEENIKEIPRKESTESFKEKFVWTPKMSVYETKIDNQHKKLLDKFNELVKKISFGGNINIIRGVIDFLEKYVKEHFSYEEKYMEKHKYPDLEKHKKIHIWFVEFLIKFKQEFESIYKSKTPSSGDIKKLSEKAKKFLGEWLVNHIMVEDHKYYEYIQEHEKNIKQTPSEEKTEEIDMSKIKEEIVQELKAGKIDKPQAQVKEQRAPISHVVDNTKEQDKKLGKNYVKTYIPGFDDLYEKGIPKGSAILVAGGAGSGKTILNLQIIYNHASQGDNCLYMSFEESEKKLIQHMKDFGWDPEKYVKKGNLFIKRFNPFDITRSVDALLLQAKGELLIELNPIILPQNFKPDIIVVDSLTAIASAFTGKEDSYRIYIEQLFRFFEKIGATSFLITETKQIPTIFSQTGVEEFLADGVIVLYNIKKGNIRENAIEILKMRGETHQKKIVAMTIGKDGITVYPEQEVFSDIEGEK